MNTKKKLAIVRALYCDNLSDTECALVFRCRVAKVHQAVVDVMLETGLPRSRLWTLFGVPEIHIVKSKKAKAIGAKATALRRMVELRNETIRLKPWLLEHST